MRSFFILMGISSYLVAGTISDAHSRGAKHENESHKDIIQCVLAQKKNRTQITEFYEAGSIREIKVYPRNGKLKPNPYSLFRYDETPIIQTKTQHRDGSTTYSISGIKFEDIPVQHPNKKRKLVIDNKASSLVDQLFSSGHNLKGKEKVTAEIDDQTQELVELLFADSDSHTSQPRLRAWKKAQTEIPALKKAQKLRRDVVELQKLEGRGKKRKLNELYEKSERLRIWGQNGLNKHVEHYYEKTNQQFPGKLRSWTRLKRDGALENSPEALKTYLGSRHNQIKEKFPPKTLEASNKPAVFSMLDELSDTSSTDSIGESGDYDTQWITDSFLSTQPE